MDDRFEHPALESIYQALEDIRQAEELLKETKEQLHQYILELPDKIGENDDLRDDIINHLYWFERNIQAQWLKDAFGLKGDGFNHIASSAHITCTCDICKQPFTLEITSRSNLDSYLAQQRRAEKKGYRPHHKCSACHNREDAAYKQSSAAYAAKQVARLQELRTMPYRQYLQTPEWQETRRRHLKSTGYRCQVCNAYGVALNVHHRTYERRGNESFKDLIVLCQQCHEIFHENGRLSEVEQ